MKKSILFDFFGLLKQNQILRRYIVMNSFDGALSSLGIIIAMWFSGVTDPRLVLISGIGVIFATGISGAWGAYLVEKAERKHELSQLKKLEPKKDFFKLGQEFRKLTVLMGLANGASSTIIGLIAISPFLLAGLQVLSIETAYLFSVLIILIVLFLIGSITALIAKENMLKHASITIFSAAMVAVIVLIFELVKVV